MNKTLKWILIGLGIALAAFLIAMPILHWALDGARPLGLAGARVLGRASRGVMLMPFFGIFGFLRVLFPLGILALVVTGIVLLVRGTHARNTATMPPAQPVQPVQPAVEAHVCKSCGKPLSAEGEYCPFCGTKQ